MLLGLVSAGAVGVLGVAAVDAVPPAARSIAALTLTGQLPAGAFGALGPQAVPVAAVGEALPGLPAEPSEPRLQRLRIVPAPRVGAAAGAAAAQARPAAGSAPGRGAVRASRSRRLAAPAPAWVLPTHGVFSSPYGFRWGRLHAGIDLAAPIGTPIVAAGPGVVVAAERERGYGNVVRIRHAGGVVTVYGHMSRIFAYVGETVSAGERIGAVGNTGHSTGPHLHFEVRPGGTRPINPLPWLRARGIDL